MRSRQKTPPLFGRFNPQAVQYLDNEMPNQRDAKMKRATITVDRAAHAWALAEAKLHGINDFSTFVRMLIAKEKNRKGRVKG